MTERRSYTQPALTGGLFCIYKPTPTRDYTVNMMRTEYRRHTLVVNAESPEAAEDLAREHMKSVELSDTHTWAADVTEHQPT